MDVADIPGVDIKQDIQNIPYPFEDGLFQEILCQDVLEHVDFPKVLRELHRIAAPGALIHIRVPHFTSKDAFSDPTHIRCFSVHTFRYFTSEHERSYYFDFTFSRLVKVIIGFEQRIGYPWNYILEPFVNSARAAQNFYEGSPLRVFPAQNITAVLQK